MVELIHTTTVRRLRETLRKAGASEELIDNVLTATVPEHLRDFPEDAVRNSEICDELGLPRPTLSCWIDRGHIRCWKITHRERYVSRSEVLRRLAQTNSEN